MSADPSRKLLDWLDGEGTRAMNEEMRRALQAEGWVTGDAEDFLELTQAERDLVELRLAVSRAVQARRKRERLTQKQAAERLNTSQPRFARIEFGARGVSLDLMFRSLYALGGSIKDVRTTARGNSQLAGRVAKAERSGLKSIDSEKQRKTPGGGKLPQGIL